MSVQVRPAFADEIERAARERSERWARARYLSGATHPLPIQRAIAPIAPAVATSPTDPRPIAENREPCRRCGTRGDIGCAHQRPCGELS